MTCVRIFCQENLIGAGVSCPGSVRRESTWAPINFSIGFIGSLKVEGFFFFFELKKQKRFQRRRKGSGLADLEGVWIAVGTADS